MAAIERERGIIGHISVDDPRIPQAVNAEVLEPMEVFAGLAALAAERAARMEKLKRHMKWLHGSYQIGQQLTRYRSLKGLLNEVLDIQSNEADHFTEEDRQVLESIGGQMAITLSNIKRREKLKDISVRDPLAGLYNRRYFNQIIERAMEKWNRESGLDFHVGLSIGMSCWSPHRKRRIEDILEEADQQMYQAKLMKGR